jgi:hypothetical protein
LVEDYIEEKTCKIYLENIKKEDIEFIDSFAGISRKILKHLIKIRKGVLKIEYLIDVKDYELVEVKLTPI